MARKRSRKLKKQIDMLSGGITKSGPKIDVPIRKGVAHPTLSPKFTSKGLKRGDLF